MPEDAGKKKFIKDFLQQVQPGEGFVEDIWIDRVVRPPGSDGEGSTAKSLSGRSISKITELLEDDLKHTFDDGYFTFRFVAALVGSGKTSLLTYLHELTKTKPTYEKHSVVVRFQLSDLLTVGGSQSFSIKLYCHLLAQTFWELIHNSNLSPSVKKVAENILSDFLETSEVSQLKSATKLIAFRSKFNKYFAESGVSFEDLFFEIISQVKEVESQFTFVYLTDELDALQRFPKYPTEIDETRALFKALIKRASQQFGKKIRLLIYLVGTSDNIGSFISGDSVLSSLVHDSVINLNKGYTNEFEMIRQKIEERLKGAYKGYKDFSQAEQEIKKIQLDRANTLREFFQYYTGEVLKIHEKYFEQEPEQIFEGNARQLVENECKKKWTSYLIQSAYKLSAVSTTIVLAGHAFDCCVELLHNNTPVARAFGEAKNYELLSGHLKTFDEWLKDVDFKPFKPDGTPPDLAFMIAPACPSLLQRKLELKKIQFIPSDKQTGGNSGKTDPSTSTNTVDINTADKVSLISAFKGTGVRQTTINKLMNMRTYKDLDQLASKLKFTSEVKSKLKTKLDNGDICF